MDTTILTRFTSDHYDDVNRICLPLFKKTPVNFFVYERFYDQGEAIFLSSTPDVLIKWAVDELHPTRAELDMYSSYGLKTAYFSHDMPLPLGSEVAAEKYEKVVTVAADCKLFHILFFVNRVSNYYRVCGFGIEKSSKPILNFYINALPVLETFVNYFERRADDLLDSSDDGLIYLPTYHAPLIVNENFDGFTEFNETEKLFNAEYVDEFSDIRLTIREKESLSLIAQGYTMKSVAMRLKISHRTVEQHLRNIKDKIGLNTKNQLLDFWHEYKNISGGK